MIVERHQDYQLTIPTVPVGGIMDVPLALDTDAPFAVRLVKSRNLGPTGLAGFRFETPRRMYQSQGFQTDQIQDVSAGVYRASRGVSLYPQIIYSPGGTIVCDVANNTGAPLSNVKLLFRGSKLYDSSAISLPTYPARLSGLPFTYQTIVQNVPAVAALVDNQLQIRSDADFAWRCGVCDPFTLVQDGTPSAGAVFNPANWSELYVTLKDESRKAYSNQPIHIDDLFGQGNPVATIPNTGFNANNPPVKWLAGLLTPEIYIAKNSTLYFDIVRNDNPADPATGQVVNLYFRFVGAKVFAQ